MKILVINSGSSSLKYQVINMENEKILLKGLVERIGEKKSSIKHENGTSKYTEELKITNHEEALKKVMNLLIDPQYGCFKSLSEIDAIGHRVLHCGEKYVSSVLIDDNVINAIEEHAVFGPLHNPPNLTGILAAQKLMPDVPQVAVFDTSFHQTMPPKAFLYGLPYEFYEKYKIRRYGFHGTSHKYITIEAAKMLGKDIKELKLISAHLGNGASLAAVKGGKVVDTSMGLTPLEGLVMGGRSGDVDATVPLFLLRQGYSIDEVDNILNKKSGVYGISGISNDMRDIEKAIKEGHKRAQLAFDVYTYRIAKYIGSYATILNGFDALVFTAGVGENDPEVRKTVCDYLGIFGVKLDDEKNISLNRIGGIISSDDSKVTVMVIKTNEELMIARDTKEIVENQKK
ncbi:MAG: acetate kinase [Defluviitoga tunisiensis]|jgi:acetate kinase|uniref:Acetate kinase n=1 Tax=Defluviitoga tunisiensis TaxID=1006576 RepID=A0A0C7NWS9_DEFTU|nr:acetate kinase [Defluviitoga tunisiensis]MDD3600431.1 acetate kinase [Defluviitoga tunisiensis]MDY0379886.1 acetate kinase [Defluviitoga tunisiensis]CEP77808.1 Acetate kinase [Defluviitoga tunisiensis]HHV00908.1 acetate kinase [Defluviitoga tunisiensis]HOB54744.1 acetate kinase [Defluviitoga tunisiensis]